MKKYHVKKGDKVVVNSGNFKGEEATISAILTKKDRVVLSFTSSKDRKIGKRTLKKSKLNPNGGMIERSVSVHVSNVNPVAADKTE
ncbi:KOW motif-containing protein [uncultured Victivallis sp.]|uniref:KOW motif-containing protein n=1 Tax=uncultured Victivallis sp. TaxID=354118 RepID=UPI0025D045A1|nr:KOW motif-containing protein [uncultured Victivallis sp.]